MSVAVVLKVVVALVVVMWYSGKLLKLLDDHFRLAFQRHLETDSSSMDEEVPGKSE